VAPGDYAMDGLVMSLNSEDEEELTSQNHEVHVPSSGGDFGW